MANDSVAAAFDSVAAEHAWRAASLASDAGQRREALALWSEAMLHRAEMPDGLATLIGSRGVRLSGGQLQRAAAARMFVRRPELLVCDDLSSALDVETEAVLWERVLASGSRTVLAVSHRRAALQRATACA